MSWLLQLLGIEFPPPKEEEDPVQVCSQILTHCKRLGFAAPSYPPAKLTPGFGREVGAVLDALATLAVDSSGALRDRPPPLKEQG